MDLMQCQALPLVAAAVVAVVAVAVAVAVAVEAGDGAQLQHEEQPLPGKEPPQQDIVLLLQQENAEPLRQEAELLL